MPIELYSAVYAGGDFTCLQNCRSKNPVYLSLHGQFDLKDEEIASYINKMSDSIECVKNTVKAGLTAGYVAYETVKGLGGRNSRYSFSYCR